MPTEYNCEIAKIKSTFLGLAALAAVVAPGEAATDEH
mgnify:CR=1 FL=1